MSVTDNQPTKVGQRVQEIFSNSRGWVTYINDNAEVHVDWDEKPVGNEDEVFPADALRVVEVIRIDADLFEDPSGHPLVEQTTTGTEHGTVYRLTTGEVLKGRDQMRAYLLGYHKRA